jgi:steroid delta-isomerase-like uncharacterized protein
MADQTDQSRTAWDTFLDAFRRRDWSALEATLDEAFEDLTPNRGAKSDRQGFIETLQSLVRAFPDFTLNPSLTLAVDDYVVVSSSIRGTQQNEWNGIPATNRTVDIGTISITRYRDGRAIEHQVQIDGIKMLEQLGVLPAQ